MLQIPETLKKLGVIKFYQEFYDAIVFRKENITNIRTGHQHYQIEHILKAGEVYGININWIYGLESSFYRESLAKDTVHRIVHRNGKSKARLQ